MPDIKLQSIIEKKRDGKQLDREDIGHLVRVATALARNETATEEMTLRCQIGATLMAIYCNGLNSQETHQLTVQMRDSGKIFEWSKMEGPRVVDKHSTGGVGDKISLVLAPALAACQLLVPMISGRSLGHTGGTLDKLESIKGLSVNQSEEWIHQTISTVGCCIVGQTGECVPSDKMLYECRDLTCTVTCPSLIIASIASKKLSENPAALLYDVKFGKGSNFKTQAEAMETAKGLIVASSPVKAVAFLTSMEAPLGFAVGDMFEVLEAVECLKGNGPTDVLQLTTVFGKELCQLTNTDASVIESLKNGAALRKFHDMLIQQNVDPQTAVQLCYGDAKKAFRSPSHIHKTEITFSGCTGYISAIDPLVLGKLWKEEYTSSARDPGVGFLLYKTVGDKISSGDVWVDFYHVRKSITDEERQKLREAIVVSSHKTERKLIVSKIYLENDVTIVEKF